MAKKYIAADEFHIHRKNFPTLFQHVESSANELKHLIKRGDRLYDLINLHGDYEEVLTKSSKELGVFSLHFELFNNLSKEQLFHYSLHGINLFEIAKLEMLSLLLSQDNWCEKNINPDNYFIYQKAFSENHRELLLNMASAAFWIATWMTKFEYICSNHYCFVFSGACTYARGLMELCRRSPTKCYVLESTFTGNDYFCEERYDAIPNNSNIRFPTFRNRILATALKDASFIPEREIVKAKSKIVEMKNKNVTQPQPTSLPKFKTPSKIILISGQVVNDFSILTRSSINLSSIYTYKSLIESILRDTDLNIIIKTHPWESKKVHLKSSFTFDKLSSFLKSLSGSDSSRILLVEHENFYNLLKVSDYFLTLCSQSGLEAALEGFKPIIIGESFYSGAGFTSDFASVREAVLSLAENKCSPILSLDEQHKFEDFILALFQCHTVSIHKSGLKQLRQIFTSPYSHINQSRRLAKELEVHPSWVTS